MLGAASPVDAVASESDAGAAGGQDWAKDGTPDVLSFRPEPSEGGAGRVEVPEAAPDAGDGGPEAAPEASAGDGAPCDLSYCRQWCGVRFTAHCGKAPGTCSCS